MRVLLEGLLAAHLACGGQALLLSATLGASARARYLALGRKGADGTPPDFAAACASPYPAISDNSGIRAVASTARPKVVAWRIEEAMDEPERITALAIEAAERGAKVLVIRNTVPAAVATLRAMEMACPKPEWLFMVNGEAALHHSRFSRQDRPLLDEAIEVRLGKGSPAGAAIVVGTQTLEQSLDIDADLLITDLCPMDVLLQRIGRLHRHVRFDRPDGFETPSCIVAVPQGRDLTPLLRRPQHGLGIVYPEVRVIEATWRLIEAFAEIEIPAMNRELVERSTHPAALARIDAELGPAWLAAAQKLAGETAARTGIARLHGIDRTKPFGDVAFADLDEIVRTRLGADDRLVDWQVVGVEPPLGPFGQRVQTLTIPGFLCKGLPADAAPAPPEPDTGGFAFGFGSKRFRYGRLGLTEIKETETC
jgi:CRISPR-associated endonuclease/helicase Cas3